MEASKSAPHLFPPLQPDVHLHQLAYGAMVGLLSNPAVTEGMKMLVEASTFDARIAAHAYNLAEAMIEEGRKRSAPK